MSKLPEELVPVRNQCEEAYLTNRLFQESKATILEKFVSIMQTNTEAVHFGLTEGAKSVYNDIVRRKKSAVVKSKGFDPHRYLKREVAVLAKCKPADMDAIIAMGDLARQLKPRIHADQTAAAAGFTKDQLLEQAERLLPTMKAAA